MKLLIVTPAPPGSRQGNRVTASRWAGLFRKLGHRVELAETYDGQRCDLLVALHARKSAPSCVRYRREHPQQPLIVVLTGTDLYRDLPKSRSAQRSLELADRLVVLQSLAKQRLPSEQRSKVRVIVQSAIGRSRTSSSSRRPLQVVVIGHLRPVKDPFRTAIAARSLPDESRIQVVHLGAALDPKMAQRAKAEMSSNPRYRWLGNLSHTATMQRLANSDVLVNSSKMEGGANAICEALACGVPVLSSRIDGSIGLLGDNYPGYFDVGNTTQLARLLVRFESDETFRNELRRHCRALAGLVNPLQESTSWKNLLAELVASNC